MNSYLVVITTVLVLTQIIRLVQNSISLKSIKKTDKINQEIFNENMRVRQQNDELYEISIEIYQILKRWEERCIGDK